MTIKITSEKFSLASAFTISRGTKTHAEVIVVTVGDGTFLGRGECVPYGRYEETIESVTRQIEKLPSDVTLKTLHSVLPAGAARNAVDCALWDLEAKKSGTSVWKMTGEVEPKPLTTAYTLSLDAPAVMQENAKANAYRPLLKIKLGGPNDLSRLEAVRTGAPDAEIIIDANEGWTEPVWLALQQDLQDLGVVLVEQPLPATKDQCLADHEHMVPLCADESCHTSLELAQLKDRYEFINIKLDKTGGLSEALITRERAIELGLGIMVGCMVGTSLGMAPAILLAQGAKFVDLDGPLLLAEDRPNGLRYDGSIVYPPTTDFWG
ncbi:MAG: N-acetyl-D-Glu racemase DgcA [Pseudomonadota bacterium]